MPGMEYESYATLKDLDVLKFKPPVRAATTANITLSGTQTIDGVSIVADDRVLVKDQSTGAENGIYVAASGAWARSADYDQDAEVTGGSVVFVSEGTANGNQGWMLTTNDPITVGSTALVFASIGTGIANVVEDATPQLGGNLDLNGNTITGLEIGTDVQAWSAVLDATTASFLTADETKLDGIETAATADQTGAEIKTAYELEADTNAFTDADHTKLDGIATAATANDTDANLKARANHTGTQASSTISDLATVVKAYRLDEFADPTASLNVSDEDLLNIGGTTFQVNRVAATGATETIAVGIPVHRLIMDQACTLSFSGWPADAIFADVLFRMSGAFTITWPAAVDWPDASAPTYTTPSWYYAWSEDAGTTIYVIQLGKAFG